MTDACSTSHLFLRHCCVSLCPGPFVGLVHPKQVGRKPLYSQAEPAYKQVWKVVAAFSDRLVGIW